MKDVVRAEVLKLLDAGIIYPVAHSEWVSPVQVVPKKAGVTVVTNDEGVLVPTRVPTGWRVCIDYRKLNASTRKDHKRTTTPKVSGSGRMSCSQAKSIAFRHVVARKSAWHAAMWSTWD